VPPVKARGKPEANPRRAMVPILRLAKTLIRLKYVSAAIKTITHLNSII
jgi:hypothetical protein